MPFLRVTQFPSSSDNSQHDFQDGWVEETAIEERSKLDFVQDFRLSEPMTVE
jgi:hypothetical protein